MEITEIFSNKFLQKLRESNVFLLTFLKKLLKSRFDEIFCLLWLNFSFFHTVQHIVVIARKVREINGFTKETTK